MPTRTPQSPIPNLQFRAFVANQLAMKPLLEKLERKELAVVVALGDSITCNATFTRGFKQWPELLHSEIRIHYSTQDILMVNAGICGNKASHGLARLDSQVLRFHPAAVIVSFGSNDAKSVGPKEFRGQMTDMVGRISDAGAVPIVRTPPPVMELQPAPPHIWMDDAAHWRLIDELRAVADECSLPMADIHAAWRHLEEQGTLDIQSLMHDCVHPNERGHQLIARQMSALFGMPPTFHWERGDVVEEETADT